jgi:hypothetical protein
MTRRWTLRVRNWTLYPGALLALPVVAFGQAQANGWPHGRGGLALFGIPLEFVLFALVLLGVALFHHRTMQVALAGLAAILAFKFLFTEFNLLHHLELEWRTLTNLFGPCCRTGCPTIGRAASLSWPSPASSPSSLTTSRRR